MKYIGRIKSIEWLNQYVDTRDYDAVMEYLQKKTDVVRYGNKHVVKIGEYYVHYELDPHSEFFDLDEVYIYGRSGLEEKYGA